MSILTNLILTGSLLALQIAVIFSLFFILITISISIITITISTKYQNEKSEKELMSMANMMLEKNYIQMKESQDIIRKQVHDFKNHIRTLNGML